MKNLQTFYFRRSSHCDVNLCKSVTRVETD